ncbi:MAG: HAMP domain-containing histidine kinase [Lactobacillus sp.]|nr:HAMP domain-containing histidine kinase [Lactobacillus sp.]
MKLKQKNKVKKRKNTKKSFFSLKLKWSVGTGIGVLVIFAVFSVLLFQSFSTLLMNQEKRYAQEALETAVESLATNTKELTRNSAENSLSLKVRTDHNIREVQTLYSSSFYTALTRENISVSVYNLSNEMVFASRDVPVKFDPLEITEETTVKRTQNSGVLVLGKKVVSKSNKQVIGYVQVTDDLVNYDKTRRKLTLIFLVFCLIAAIGIALLSYGLSSLLLRPIESINNTIGIINGDDESDALANVRVPEFAHEDELAELGRLFNKMLDRMQRYVEQQQQFVEDVSHELRTPVAVIQGHLSLLKRWGKNDPAVLDESIDASLQEISRMKSLVQEMLDLSRAEQVEIQFGKEITNAKEVGLQVFNNFQMIHPDFNFVLDDDLNDKAEVQIYRNHLEQVLIILMDNAVKYSKDRKEVHLTLSKNINDIDIVVQDFGEGISQENIKRIFDRFYRVDKARSRDKGGNGLGLSIARRLIEGYHGKLIVESAVGQGSLFKISLPLAKPKDDSKNK